MDLTKLSDDDRRFWERYATTGVHSFWFIDGTDDNRSLDDVIRTDLLHLIPNAGDTDAFTEPLVLSAATFAGTYAAFAHLWAPPNELAALQHYKDVTLAGSRLRGRMTLQAKSYQSTKQSAQIFALKLKKCNVVALVKIWGARDSLEAVMERASHVPGFRGAAIVFGDFDVLVELDADDYDTAVATALVDLAGVAGVERTETAFADYRRYDDAEEPET